MNVYLNENQMKKNFREKNIITQLLKKGVCIPCPESVEIGPDIDSEMISGEGVVIHAGCKIYGAKTLIMSNVVLGYEAPVTIYNCQLGRNVRLNGGFFYESCFLEGAQMGSGAQIREACLLEEGARGGHTVGLKQTILFPYVTLGSLINLCDCLIAGGTDEKNHSEVGSSYIHFNYTPNQDKATASLAGNVPEGVMVNKPPIFLGGQGGIVGPVRIGFGTVVAAGTVVRNDLLKENIIHLDHTYRTRSINFFPGLYNNIKRIITLNTIYIANIIALRRWYKDVRLRFVNNNPMEITLLEGALDKLEKAISERIKRLGEVANRMPESIEIYTRITSSWASESTLRKKKAFYERWPEINQVFIDSLGYEGDRSQKEAFLNIIERYISRKAGNYLQIIKGLTETESRSGTEWLQGLINKITNQVWKKLPGF